MDASKGTLQAGGTESFRADLIVIPIIVAIFFFFFIIRSTGKERRSRVRRSIATRKFFLVEGSISCGQGVATVIAQDEAARIDRLCR
jgi:hypothetical protein